MTHPLATDPTTPAILRAAFGRVPWADVMLLDDGSETPPVNCVSPAARDQAVTRALDIEAAHKARGLGFSACGRRVIGHRVDSI